MNDCIHLAAGIGVSLSITLLILVIAAGIMEIYSRRTDDK